MKNTILYILIGLISLSIGCETVKLFSKKVISELVLKLCDLDDDASQEDDKTNEKENKFPFAFVSFSNKNFNLFSSHKLRYNSLYKSKLPSFIYIASIDFPPEL